MYILLIFFLLLPSLSFGGATFGGTSAPGGGSSGAMENKDSTNVGPGASGIDWIWASGDVNASRIGSDGSGSFFIDTDGDEAADCTISKLGGVVTIDCNNTNVDLTPGQTNGDVDINDSAGTLCVKIDPDDGGITQGTNCGNLAFDGEITKVNSVNQDTGASVALSAGDCHGRTHYNNDADAITYTLPDGETGGGQACRFFDKAGGAITIDVNDGSETITDENGTALSAGEAIILASGYGNWVILESESATSWLVTAVNGDLTEETP